LTEQLDHSKIFCFQFQKTCKVSQLVLLGHSIGGYVARLTPLIYPETKPYIANIVTLGSPHAHPVFGWESTVHALHQAYLVKDTSEDSVLVAISGGLRDEMIPPVACEASHGLSVRKEF
jgi:pimeloyl-ACP methyl ester carboxylesterase